MLKITKNYIRILVVKNLDMANPTHVTNAKYCKSPGMTGELVVSLRRGGRVAAGQL